MLYVDHGYIVEWLRRNDYVAFIGDDSILPRESSVSDKPLKNAIPFKSPEKLRRVIRLPSGKSVSGMVVPRGLVVVTGGGYHGKTTLLNSIIEAIYPHVRGDGREYVVSLPRTFYVEAEDGRIVSCVDISSFIDPGKLPGGFNVECFSTMDASGSTSMAASINEAIELGAEALLIDEDTAATNLLYKDRVMEKLLKLEPIKPLDKQAKSMIERTRAGLVIVSSASSTYLEIADHVIVMENYQPHILEYGGGVSDSVLEYRMPRRRWFVDVKGLVKIRARGYKIVARYRDGSTYELDVSRNKRIVEKGQVKTIVEMIMYIIENLRGKRVEDIVDELNKVFRRDGFKAFTRNPPPDLSWADPVDTIWALNRLYNAVLKN